MIRLVWKILKTGTFLSILGGGSYYASQRFPDLNPFDGKTVLRVVEIKKMGELYIGRRYTLTENNRLYLSKSQSLSLTTGVSEIETQSVTLTSSQKEVILDIAMNVDEPKKEIPIDQNNNHYLSIGFNEVGTPYVVLPQKQRTAGVLARTLYRFSQQGKKEKATDLSSLFTDDDSVD